jgi:hypothetical protein
MVVGANKPSAFQGSNLVIAVILQGAATGDRQAGCDGCARTVHTIYSTYLAMKPKLFW